MKAYKKILLFFMIIILAVSSVSIIANAESIKKYDNNFSWGSESWQFIGGGNEVVYKPIIFNEETSELAQYLSVSINNVPWDLNDFESIIIQNFFDGSGYTYSVSFDKVEEGKYYTEMIEYSEYIDSNIIIIALVYNYSLTQEDLITLNSVWIDVWKWYSEPDYNLLLSLDSKYWEVKYLSLLDEIDSLYDEISLLQDEIQQLEDALDLEFDRGYNEGYNIGYEDGLLAGDFTEAYEEGFKDGEKSKLAKNNESFYNSIGIWVPAIILVIALGSIVSITAFKMKE